MQAIERLMRMRDGIEPCPAIYAALGISVTDAAEGVVQLRFSPSAALANPQGKVAGGAIATVLDTAAAWACETLLARTGTVTTIECKVNFLRSVALDDAPLSAIGRVMHPGRTIMVAEARLVSARGMDAAFAIISGLVLRQG
jgi:uncharacterized protein (TIGR00369 family)